MNNARNNVIGISSNVVVACGVDGPGTASEVALAIKNGKPVILLEVDQLTMDFYQRMGGTIVQAHSPEDVIKTIHQHKWC
jgi:hypothetical protein